VTKLNPKNQPLEIRKIPQQRTETTQRTKKKTTLKNEIYFGFVVTSKVIESLVTVAASSKGKASRRGDLTMNENATSNRRDGVFQRCGLCSLLSSLLRRAMCVGSRRGSGDSYYQELAETVVS
jgi:hypothetical protein